MRAESRDVTAEKFRFFRAEEQTEFAEMLRVSSVGLNAIT